MYGGVFVVDGGVDVGVFVGGVNGSVFVGGVGGGGGVFCCFCCWLLLVLLAHFCLFIFSCEFAKRKIQAHFLFVILLFSFLRVVHVTTISTIIFRLFLKTLRYLSRYPIYPSLTYKIFSRNGLSLNKDAYNPTSSNLSKKPLHNVLYRCF